jgi:hypothetical protein
MASQKLTNCCVAAIALTASTYVSTPHCSTIARLAFGAFCLAIDIDAFLRKHHHYCKKLLKSQRPEKYVSPGNGLRLVDQHHRDTIADWIGKTALVTNQQVLGLGVAHRRLALRTGENFQ